MVLLFVLVVIAAVIKSLHLIREQVFEKSMKWSVFISHLSY